MIYRVTATWGDQPTVEADCSPYRAALDLFVQVAARLQSQGYTQQGRYRPRRLPLRLAFTHPTLPPAEIRIDEVFD